MKRNMQLWVQVLVTAVLLVGWPHGARAAGQFELVTGKAFDGAVPRDFYLEGNAIPVEKRNAAVLKSSAGTRAVFALIDTTGYSSQIKQKYIGMVITEGKMSVCGISLAVGSYGFGLDRPAAPSDEDAKFFVYNQAGEKVGDCASKKDAAITQPNPLQVVLGEGKPARLYLGRFFLAVE